MLWYRWRWVRRKPIVSPSVTEVAELVGSLARASRNLRGDEKKPAAGVQAGQTRKRAQERRKETLLRFADQGETYRERITRAAYPSPPSFIGTSLEWPILQVLLIKWLSELHEYARRELSEDFVGRIPMLGAKPIPKHGLDVIDETIRLIEETVDAMP